MTRISTAKWKEIEYDASCQPRFLLTETITTIVRRKFATNWVSKLARPHKSELNSYAFYITCAEFLRDSVNGIGMIWHRLASQFISPAEESVVSESAVFISLVCLSFDFPVKLKLVSPSIKMHLLCGDNYT